MADKLPAYLRTEEAFREWDASLLAVGTSTGDDNKARVDYARSRHHIAAAERSIAEVHPNITQGDKDTLIAYETNQFQYYFQAATWPTSLFLDPAFNPATDPQIYAWYKFRDDSLTDAQGSAAAFVETGDVALDDKGMGHGRPALVWDAGGAELLELNANLGANPTIYLSMKITEQAIPQAEERKILYAENGDNSGLRVVKNAGDTTLSFQLRANGVNSAVQPSTLVPYDLMATKGVLSIRQVDTTAVTVAWNHTTIATFPITANLGNQTIKIGKSGESNTTGMAADHMVITQGVRTESDHARMINYLITQ